MDCSVSTIANPPERIIVDANSAWRIRSSGFRVPMVATLFHSLAPQLTAPTRNSTRVVVTVSLVCSDHRPRPHR